MLELQILAGCMEDRKCYDVVAQHLESKELSPETQKILRHIGDYYERDGKSSSAHRDLVEASVIQSIPDHQDKHRELFKQFFERIPRTVSPGNVFEYVVGIKRDRIRSEIHQACLAKVDGPQLEKLFDKWRDVGHGLLTDDSTREVYTGWNLDDLVSTHHQTKNLIKLLPVTLNKRADGGAKPGHHILIFAPTELGKSLFAINMAYGFLLQKLRVLYVGNEDPVADLQMRLVNRITNNTRAQVREAKAGAYAEALKKANYENFTIAGLSPGRFTEIADLTKEYDPHVVILDQLGNLEMGKDIDGQTVQLLHASKAARNLAKKEARLVVSVCQAADDAFGRKKLRKNDVQWSNVDVPGTVDLQVGVGATPEMEEMGLRCVTPCKNKLGGDHKEFDVRFVTEYSKVEELAQAA